MITSILVKGDRLQAEASAKARGIVLLYVREIRSTGNITVQAFTNASEDDLNKWLSEYGEAPYPGGTLLHWRESAFTDSWGE